MKKIFKVLLIEDELIFQISIESMLYETDYKIYKVLSNTDLIEDILEKNEFDLILCDLYIDGAPKGIEFIKKFDTNRCPIICITSSQKLKDYEEINKKVSGYLVKPFHKLTMISTIQRAIDKFQKYQLLNFLSGNYLLVNRTGGKIEKINFDDIIFIEASANYCLINTANKGRFAMKISLVKLLKSKLNKFFIRVHHKYAINSAYILSYSSTEVKLTAGYTFPVGASYNKNIKTLYNNKID